MNYIKNICASLVIMLFAATANAQSLKITIGPVSVAVDEETEIVMNYESDIAMRAGQFEIVLPEGLTFVEMQSVDGEEPELDLVKGTALSSKHDISYKKKDEAGSHYAFLIGGLTKNTLKNSGSLMTFKVKANEVLAESSEILVKNIKFAPNSTESTTTEDLTVPVTKSTPTGINGIEANSEKAESFNLAGQKVSANAKGIRIQNGKKIVVK